MEEINKNWLKINGRIKKWLTSNSTGAKATDNFHFRDLLNVNKKITGNGNLWTTLSPNSQTWINPFLFTKKIK